MAGKVLRIADYKRKSRTPDAAHPRDPVDADAIVIVLPIVRIERQGPALPEPAAIWPEYRP